MDIRDRRGLKKAAKDALNAASYDPRKLILIHTAVSAALSLILSLVDHVLQLQIGGTGGLSGVGNRAILETVQLVLMVAQVVAVVFWQIGYVFVALRIGRWQEAGPESLLEGFRRFGPVLRLRLALTFMYMGMGLLCMYIGSTIFSMMPWAEPLVAAYENGSEEAIMAAIDACTLPMLAVTAVVALVLVVPYWYRLRLAEYALMDEPRLGAMMSIRKSRWLMRGNAMHFLKMDLSFWWFFALETLVSVIAYGDVLLPLFGVTLPWSETVSYYVFLVLCYVAQIVLYWWKGNDVRVTYALCYDAVLPKEET